MKLDTATCRRLFASAQVARLATRGAERPHLVPIVFAADEDTIVSIVDDKPKSTTRLQRLANLSQHPEATLLVDHYDADWSRLWWVRADVTGRVASAPAEVAAIATRLAQRYQQYRERPPTGPAIVFEVARWTGWAASAVTGQADDGATARR